jgi:2-(1,2-epoxy-1,2-dihydrophenyl)acetyl-CoA isomerase
MVTVLAPLVEPPPTALPPLVAPQPSEEAMARARAQLRAQIADLERRLADTVAAGASLPAALQLPLAPAPEPARGAPSGPRLLTLEELETSRDRLVNALASARAAASAAARDHTVARRRLEAMLADPRAYKFARVANADLGLPGCATYHVRPRLGLLGMLAGWWEVKLSSGCPLSGAPAIDWRAMSDYQLAHEYDTVRVWRDGAATKIELNRPESMNAWNRQFGFDLLDAVQSAAQDDDVRAVLITGAGRGFSSGADLKESADDRTPDGHPDVRTTLTERYHPIITGIRHMPKPVVSAVNGAAVGIGLSLALAADLIVAKESAYFLLAFVNIGLVPDGGSSLFIPTRIGMARATEMAILGERIPAPQALDWGLINRVVPDEDFDAEVDSLVARLAAGPTRSYAGTKRQLNHWLYTRMDEQLALEADIQQQMAESQDFVEGVMAFVQKREAAFGGR